MQSSLGQRDWRFLLLCILASTSSSYAPALLLRLLLVVEGVVKGYELDLVFTYLLAWQDLRTAYHSQLVLSMHTVLLSKMMIHLTSLLLFINNTFVARN